RESADSSASDERLRYQSPSLFLTPGVSTRSGMSSGKTIPPRPHRGSACIGPAAVGVAFFCLCMGACILANDLNAGKETKKAFAIGAGSFARSSPCDWTLLNFEKPAGKSSGQKGPSPSDPENREGFVFDSFLSDEFAGATLDLSKWRPGVEGWNGRPPALFVPENLSQSGGMLRLKMAHQPVPAKFSAAGYKDYTTAAIQSRKAVLYGYFEIRAKIMPSAGSSAFWLAKATPQNWNEIDVFEIG